MGEARQVADRLTDAINRHDPDAAAACFHEDGEIIDPFDSARGREEIREYWRSFMEAFPDMSGAAERTYEDGNTAIDEWTFTGTHTGPLRSPDGQEIPPTGRTVTIRGADFATVEGGLIRQDRVYFDQMAFLAQLGLIPEQTQATA